MTLHDVTLDDKYDLTKGRIFVSGAQAVIRMMLMQRERDRRAGLSTAGFASGYRGSPLGTLDQQFWRARNDLEQAGIRFQPGLNEELAATAIWGTQYAELEGMGKYDGVFGLWYGKGPGVDRTGDAFRHANMAGSSKHGGVLALMGDDHTAESSTLPHQSEFAFVDTMIPILNPAGVQEIIDYGQYGYALSRFAGTWAAFKCVKDNIESTASVDGSFERVNIVLPDIDLPDGGLNVRYELDFLAQEERLHDHKRRAAAAFIHANNLNRVIFSGGRNAKLGIITVGKNYLDVCQALDDIGVGESKARELGLRLFKVACPWPLDLDHIKDFARGLDMIIVVEEKRSLIESQLRESLYGSGIHPVIVGKTDERGDRLFPVQGALDPNDIAIAVGERILRVIGPSEEIGTNVKRLRQFQAMLADTSDVAVRLPYFCSGCPHNSSTKVPEGSRAGAGIGCHFMSIWMDRNTAGFTAMGGEGANWVGESAFTKRKHLFQNLGDGTYNHSGSLAIRFAVAAGTNITYKILFNDAVAMTGGQPHEGNLTVDAVARQIRAEGVQRIAIVTDEPEKYSGQVHFPDNVSIDHRNDLDAIQRELREIPGVTAIIYDQTCAAEKRRRRKRGTFPDPDKRVIINELVCEGCGDCGVQSNCVSIQPVETEFGRKRRIDQSSCNKDFSCVEGFCPSFVTVHGAKIRKAEGISGRQDPLDGVPQPQLYPLDNGWSCIIDGVGGTGVVTIGAILGMAAHLENKGCGMIDMAGLAQKGGAVFSHVRIANTPDDINAIRISAGKADLILGCDLVVSGAKKVLAAVRHGHTTFVANTAEIMPGDFARSADFSLPIQQLNKAIRDAAGDEKSHFFDATRAAAILFGNSIGSNMFMLGFAFQHGGLPLSGEAVEEAIELNAQAVAMNVSAFRWGRRAAHEPELVRRLLEEAGTIKPVQPPADDIDEIISRRASFLADYQNADYAKRYLDRIARLRVAEEKAVPGSKEVTEAAARNLFKLMAVKDEYEVGRLYAGATFANQLTAQFDGYDRLEFHLAPPVFSRRDASGKPVKSRYGSWMMKVFGLLSRLKVLRGTPLDVFGYSDERRMERRLLSDYESDLDMIGASVNSENIAAAAELAGYPARIRGFGHVKEESAGEALQQRVQAVEKIQNSSKNDLLAAAE